MPSDTFRYDRRKTEYAARDSSQSCFQHGILSILVAFFSQHAMSESSFQNPMERRGIAKEFSKETTAHRLSIHSCSSVFVDAQSLKESEEIWSSATNAGKPIIVVWVVRFGWLLLVVVLGFCCSQFSCCWFGYLVALCFACLMGGGFERCERLEKPCLTICLLNHDFYWRRSCQVITYWAYLPRLGDASKSSKNLLSTKNKASSSHRPKKKPPITSL